MSYNGERYVFAAPLIQQVIRDEWLTRGQRQRLRARAVEILASRPDVGSEVLRAELLMRIHKPAEALRTAIAAAGRSGELVQPSLMRRALRAAEQAADEDDMAARARIAALQTRLDALVASLAR